MAGQQGSIQRFTWCEWRPITSWNSQTGLFRLISTSLWDCKWLPIVLMKLAHLAVLGFSQGLNLTEFLFDSLKQDSGQASCFSPKPNRALKPLRGDHGSRMFSTHGPASSSMKCRTCKRPKVCFTKKDFSKNEHESNKLKSYSDFFLEKKTYIYKNKNQSWNCFENVDNQQMLCFTTKRSLFYLSNFQPPRPAHGKHGNSIQQTLQPPHWQHHLSPVEFLATSWAMEKRNSKELADLNGFLHYVLGKKLRICWK